MLSRDSERPARVGVRAVRDERRVARAVKLRSRVVGDAAVDRNPRPLPGALDRSDAVERHARLPDE